MRKKIKIPRFDNGSYKQITEPLSDDFFINNSAFTIDPNTGYSKVLDKNGNVLTENGVVQLPEINITGVSPQTKWQRAEDIYRSQTMKDYEQGTKDARNILEALVAPFAVGEGAADLITSLSRDMFTKEALRYGGKMLWDNKWNIAKNFVKGGVKGEIASTVGNTALDYITGYTAPQLISEATGLPEGVTEWMDPFFLYGAGAKWPGERRLSQWLKNKIPTYRSTQSVQPINRSYAYRIKKLQSKMENGGLSIDDLVDKNGNIVDNNLAPVLRIFADTFKEGGSLGRGGYHPRSSQTTLEHLYATAKSAQQLQQPEGITKQQQVFEALTHDIGEFISRENHPAHSREIIQKIFPNSAKEVLDDVAAHMNTAYGTESLKALHAADVITGGDVEQMLNNNPLINYGPYTRNTNIGRPDIKSLPTSELISRVNEWLTTRGLPQIDVSLPQEEAMQLLRNTMLRYRTVMRGVSLIENEDGSFGGRGEIGEYATNFIKKLMSEGKSKEEAVDEFFKHIVTTAPEIKTNHNKQGWFDFLKKDGFSEYSKQGFSNVPEKVPGKISLRRKESEDIVDADMPIYTSNSADVATGYASGGTYGSGYYAEVPELYDSSMSLIDYVLANDFPLYDTAGKLDPKYNLDVPANLLMNKEELAKTNLEIRQMIKLLSHTVDLNFFKNNSDLVYKVLSRMDSSLSKEINRIAQNSSVGEHVSELGGKIPKEELQKLSEVITDTGYFSTIPGKQQFYKENPHLYGMSSYHNSFSESVMTFLNMFYENISKLKRGIISENDAVYSLRGQLFKMRRQVNYILENIIGTNGEISADLNRQFRANYELFGKEIDKLIERLSKLDPKQYKEYSKTDPLDSEFVDKVINTERLIDSEINNVAEKMANTARSKFAKYDPESSERLFVSKNIIDNIMKDVNVLEDLSRSIAFDDFLYIKQFVDFSKNSNYTKDDFLNFLKSSSISNSKIELYKNALQLIPDEVFNEVKPNLSAMSKSVKLLIAEETVGHNIKLHTYRKHGIYPMHQTIEANRHPKAFTTEKFNESDGHQHYVFVGRPGLKILVKPRNANLKLKDERDTHHYGRQDPNASTKLFSIAPPVIAAGYSLNSKKKNK